MVYTNSVHTVRAPCVIAMPPDFLKGSCDAHPAIAEKRYRLCKIFWGLLTKLYYFKDSEYLHRKEGQTVRDDRREILPACMIQVIHCTKSSSKSMVNTTYAGYSHDGEQRDYMSTFDAE